MIAKVITKDSTRQGAIKKMKRALNEFVITGINTNIDFHLNILENEKYIKGDFDTSFIANEIINKN